MKSSALRLSALLALMLLFLSQSFATVDAIGTQARIAYPSSYDWPMFMHSADHGGVVVSPAPLSNKEVAHVKLSGTVWSSPALFNGTLFVGGGNQFHALNSSTMLRNDTTGFKQGWNYTVGTGFSIYSSPAVGGGGVFFGATDGRVYAFDAKPDSCSKSNPNCHLRWVYQTGAAIYSSPVYDNGRIFIGSDNGKVYGIDASTGTPVWSFTTQGRVRSSPAVASSQVVVGSDDGNVYFLDESTGSMLHHFLTGGAVRSSAAIANGLAYIGSNDSSVYAIDMSSGTQVWRFATAGNVTGSPAVADGNVYVGSMDGHFYALDAHASSHQVTWQTPLDGPIASSPALADGTKKGLTSTWLPVAYVSSMGGNLYAINRQNGAIVWTKAIALKTVGSPVVAYTKVYLGDQSGKVFQVGSLRGGTALGTFNSVDVQTSNFHPGDSVRIGANTAWGRYGINQSLVTVYPPGSTTPILTNASLIFISGLAPYNYRYDYTLPNNAATGTYKITLLVEDGHAKAGSANPRCCGWIVVKGSFSVAH